MKLSSLLKPGVYKKFFKRKNKNIRPIPQSSGKVYLSIVAILKNEAPYIREWIEYHKLIGVERFYLYDNCSTDDVFKILQPYIDDGTVVYRYINGSVMQMRAYKDAIYNYANESRWMAIIDLDEFIVPVEEQMLSEFLKKYEKYPAIGINWVMFDSNGHETKPDGLVIENYTRVKYDMADNIHIKSIVNPKAVVDIVDPHYCFYSWGRNAVCENFKPIKHPHSTKDVSISKIRINHYHCKSKEEYVLKCQRGRATTTDKRQVVKKMYDFTVLGETQHDYLIQEKYLEDLKKQLEKNI